MGNTNTQQLQQQKSLSAKSQKKQRYSQKLTTHNISTTISGIKLPKPISQSFRIIFIQPQSILSNQSQQNQINIMTDYIINHDPKRVILDRKKTLEEQYQTARKQNYLFSLQKLNITVSFQVFSILNCKIREVLIKIPLTISEKQNHGLIMPKLGVLFRYYPVIHDCILRVSKVFKNSPLSVNNYSVQANQYIVGVLEYDFMSIKQFIDKLKQIVQQKKYQFLTFCVCDLNGESRLIKVMVRELIEWKKEYNVGYLGCELAEGWLNKYELRKSLKQKARRNTEPVTLIEKKQFVNQIQEVKAEMVQQSKSKEMTSQIQKQQMQTQTQIKQKQQFSSSTKPSIPPPPKKRITSQSQKISIEAFPPLEGLQQQQGLIISQIVQKSKPQTQTQHIQQKLQNCPQSPSSVSSVTSSQIQQKCSQLRSNIYQLSESHIYNPSLPSNPKLNQSNSSSFGCQNNRSQILEIKYKGILKNQLIDDASTICKCKQYSKHCERCFVEKEGNYCFYNKKISKIVIIEKNMLFPKQLL